MNALKDFVEQNIKSHSSDFLIPDTDDLKTFLSARNIVFESSAFYYTESKNGRWSGVGVKTNKENFFYKFYDEYKDYKPGQLEVKLSGFKSNQKPT